MWQVLTLTLISVGFVRSYTNCPGFSSYKHNAALLSELDGEYFVVYTSSSYVLDCERILWTVGPNNNRTASLKDAAGCCRRIDECDSSNPEYFEHDISPESTCNHLQSTERVTEKLIRKEEVGTNLCLFIYICHPSRNGLIVACRELPNATFISMIVTILLELLALLLPLIRPLRTVNQLNCIFTNTCSF